LAGKEVAEKARPSRFGLRFRAISDVGARGHARKDEKYGLTTAYSLWIIKIFSLDYQNFPK
jgi:hypothetical protein